VARASARERGTILLMVVGVLALLAIIGVVYATIGRGDRITAATKVRLQRVNDQVDEVAAYLAGVIGDATFAAYPELSATNVPFIRTRGYTYPATDSQFLSVNPVPGLVLPPGVTLPANINTKTYSRFDPTGSCATPWAHPTQSRDDRVFGDPYIAALEPERLIRPNGAPYVADIDATHPLSYANRHDWRTISNFGPSGNRVNLANLRTSRGGFNAEPGFGRDASGRPRMSFGVTLFDPDTRLPQPVGTPTSPLAVKRYDGATANPLVPADWCTNLVWGFRPNIPDQRDSGGNTINPGSYEYLPNFMADADGDGMTDSGWYELVDISNAYLNNNAQIISKVPTRGRTRLFVAARCIDSSAMLNLNTGADNASAFLSANALDAGFWRDNQTVPGATPADIDIRRLLSMTDLLREQNSANVGNTERAYQGIPRPAAGMAGDYSAAYGTANAPTIGNYTYSRLIDTRARGASTYDPATPPIDYPLPAPSRADRYSWFASSGHAGVLYAPNKRYSTNPYDLSDELDLRAFFGLNDSDSLSRLEAAMAGRAPTSGAGGNAQYQGYSPLRDNRSRALEAKWRDEREPDKFFKNYGTDPDNRQAILSIFSDVRHLVTTINGSRPMKSNGVAPDTNAQGGDVPYSGAITDVTAALQAIINYGSYERAPRSDDPARYNSNGTLLTPLDQPSKDDRDNYVKAVQLIFRLYLNALAPYTDDDNSTIGYRGHFPQAWDYHTDTRLYRQGLVYGGSAELAFRMAAHMTANFVDAFDRERRLNAPSNATFPGRAWTDATNHENLGIDRNDVTSISLDLASQTMTSGVGPNYFEPGRTRERRFIDAYKGVDVMDPLRDNTIRPAPVPPAKFPAYRLPADPSKLQQYSSFNGSSYTPSGSMNIFGIEPQPFITEVGSYFIYAAKPDISGGTGGGGGGPGGSSGGGGSGFAADVTRTAHYKFVLKAALGSSADSGNFVGEVLAFQLQNPFDQDVVLYDPAYGPADIDGVGSSDAMTRHVNRIDRFKFYLEYCGRYYSFAPQDPGSVNFDGASSSATHDQSRNDPVILHAGETRIFYVTNPGSLDKMAERVRRHGGPPAFGAADMAKWIEGTWSSGRPTGDGQLFQRSQFTLSSSGVNDGDPQRPLQMVEVYPTTFKRVQPTHIDPSASTAETGTVSMSDYMDIWGKYDYSSGNPNEVIKKIDNTAERRIVYLWRTVRSESSVTAQSNPIHGDLKDTELNDPSNDLLADRLRDPTTGSGDTDSAVFKYREPPPGPGTMVEFTKDLGDTEVAPVLAFASWGAVRRPTDKAYSTISGASGGGTLVDASGRKRPLRGVLPPWCLESKPDDAGSVSSNWTGHSNFSMNHADSHDGYYGSSKLGSFDNFNDTEGRFRSFDSLLHTTQHLNDQICRACPEKTGNDIPDLPPLTTSSSVAVRHYSDVAVEFYSVGEDRLGGKGAENIQAVTSYATGSQTTKNLAIRRSRNPALFTRAGDFLLPLAIGPWFEPSRSGRNATTSLQYPSTWLPPSAERLADREVQWMTLSEALALASGYYGPKDPNDPLFEFARLNPATQHLPLTDRGHLALDRFVPYLHTTTMPANLFQPLGSGVPFALSILDQFRAAGGISSTPQKTSDDADKSYSVLDGNAPTNVSRGVTPESEFFPTAYGTAPPDSLPHLTLQVPQLLSDLVLVPGRVNLNTLPWTALCTLPLVSPSASDSTWAFDANPTYAPAGPHLYPNGTPPLAVATNGYDLAQPIIDYRNAVRDYADRTAQHNPIWNQCLPNGTLPVRKEPGIASFGELAYINFYNTTNGANFGQIDATKSIFHFAGDKEVTGPDPIDVNGSITTPAPRLSFHPELASAGSYDRRADGRVDTGLDTSSNPVVYSPTGNSSPAARMHYDASDNTPPVQRVGTGQVISTPGTNNDNYQDKLAIINALANTASIRSDIFTVYFLIHAYTPEDCDIPDDQPLVPSVAKRYVMVVDRSNVGLQGTKPRILMLKEVPMP
jgi:hypothetical protein